MAGPPNANPNANPTFRTQLHGTGSRGEGLGWVRNFSKSVSSKVRYAPMFSIKSFAILTAGNVRRAEMHHHAKFHQDRSSRCRDITIFPFFKMAAGGHLGFLNPDILTAYIVRGPRCITMPNSVEISQVVAEILRFDHVLSCTCLFLHGAFLRLSN